MRRFNVSVTFLMLLLLSAALLPTSFALSVSTDKGQYYRGESVNIRINGAADSDFGIQVFNPVGGIFWTGQAHSGSNGVATASLGIPPDAMYGSYQVRVSGGGESGQTSFQVVEQQGPPGKRSSNIALTVSPESSPPGGKVTINGALDPALIGETINLLYEWPSGTSRKSLTTGSDGTFTDKIDVNDMGKWAVTASWGGNQQYDGCSVTANFYVKKSSSLTIILSKSRIALGSSTTITGALNPALGSESIAISVSTDRIRYSLLANAWTDSKGEYNYIYTPTIPGTYYLKADWKGSSSYFEAISPVVTLEASYAIASALTLAAEPFQITLGQNTTLKGSVEPAVSSAIVKIEYSLNSGPWIFLLNLTTDANGGFNYKWKPNDVGSYLIRASSSGMEFLVGSVGTAVLIVSRPTFSVDVQVTDSAAKPLPETLIRAIGSSSVLLITGSDGKAKALLPPGTYNVTAIWCGVPVLLTKITISENGTKMLVAKVHPLIVTYTDYEGQPVSGATVFLKISSGASLYSVTKADGKATIEQVPEGTWEVQCMGVKLTVPVTGPTEIKLSASAPNDVVPLWVFLIIAVLVILVLGEMAYIFMLRRAIYSA